MKPNMTAMTQAAKHWPLLVHNEAQVNHESLSLRSEQLRVVEPFCQDALADLNAWNGSPPPYSNTLDECSQPHSKVLLRAGFIAGQPPAESNLTKWATKRWILQPFVLPQQKYVLLLPSEDETSNLNLLTHRAHQTLCEANTTLGGL